MARRFVYVCDGCDRESTTASDELPSRWADVRVGFEGFRAWSSGGSSDYGLHRLLCGECQIALAELADPRKWPRAASLKEES